VCVLRERGEGVRRAAAAAAGALHRFSLLLLPHLRPEQLPVDGPGQDILQGTAVQGLGLALLGGAQGGRHGGVFGSLLRERLSLANLKVRMRRLLFVLPMSDPAADPAGPASPSPSGSGPPLTTSLPLQAWVAAAQRLLEEHGNPARLVVACAVLVSVLLVAAGERERERISVELCVLGGQGHADIGGRRVREASWALGWASKDRSAETDPLNLHHFQQPSSSAGGPASGPPAAAGPPDRPAVA